MVCRRFERNCLIEPAALAPSLKTASLRQGKTKALSLRNSMFALPSAPVWLQYPVSFPGHLKKANNLS
jgi:hypothetical protein